MPTLAELAALKSLVDKFGVAEPPLEVNDPLKAANIVSMIEARRANIAVREEAEARRQLNDEMLRAVRQENQLKLKQQRELAEAMARDAAKARAFYVGDGTQPAAIWQNIKNAVELENAKRRQQLKIGMLPEEEFEFTRRILNPMLENLKKAAEKDPEYRRILDTFQQTPEYQTFIAQKKPSSGMLTSAARGIGDLAVSAAAGLAEFGAGAAALGSLVTPKQVSEALAAVGINAKEWADDLRKKLGSAKLNEQKRLLSETEGFLNTIGVAISNPSMIPDLIAEMGASFGVAGLTTKGALKLAGRAPGKLAQTGSLAAGGAVAGGIDAAGDALQTATKEGLSPEERAKVILQSSGAAGAVGGALAPLGSDRYVARALGAKVDVGGRTARTSTAKRVAAGTLGVAGKASVESIEEGFQSGFASGFTKLAKTGEVSFLDFWDPKGAAIGLVVGGVVGGAGSVLSRDTPQQPAAPQQPTTAATPQRQEPPTIEVVNANATAIDNALQEPTADGTLRVSLNKILNEALLGKGQLTPAKSEERITEAITAIVEAAANNEAIASQLASMTPAQRIAKIEELATQTLGAVSSAAFKALQGADAAVFKVRAAIEASQDGRVAEFRQLSREDQDKFILQMIDAEITRLAQEGQITSASLIELRKPKQIEQLSTTVANAVAAKLPQAFKQYNELQARLQAPGVETTEDLLRPAAQKIAQQTQEKIEQREQAKQTALETEAVQEAIESMPPSPTIAQLIAEARKNPMPAPAVKRPTNAVETAVAEGQKVREQRQREANQQAKDEENATLVKSLMARRLAQLLSNATGAPVNEGSLRMAQRTVDAATETIPASALISAVSPDKTAKTQIEAIDNLIAEMLANEQFSINRLMPRFIAASGRTTTKKPGRRGPGGSVSAKSLSGDTAPTGNSVERIKSSLDAAGIPLDNINIVQTEAEARAFAGEPLSTEESGRVQGFYNPETDEITLIADAIPQGREIGVALHEIVHRADVTGDSATVKDLTQRVRQWANAREGSIERAIYDAASQRAEASGDVDSELLAYAVEEAVSRGVERSPEARSWWDKVKAFFQGLIQRIIPSYQRQLTAEELVDVAYGFAKQESRPAARGDAVRFSIRDSQIVRGTEQMVKDAVKEIARGRIGLDLRTVAITPAGMRIEALKSAVKPTLDSMIRLFQRGATTFTTMRELFDRDANGLLNGLSAEVQKLMERRTGYTQTALTRNQRVLNLFVSLPVDQMHEALDVYTRLTRAGDDASGYDPTTEPTTLEEQNLQAAFLALNPKQQEAIVKTARYLRVQYEEFIRNLKDALQAERERRGLSPELEKIVSDFGRIKFYGPLGTEGTYVLRGVRVDTTGVQSREQLADLIKSAKTEVFVRSNSYLELQALQEDMLNDAGFNKNLVFEPIYVYPSFEENRQVRPEGRFRDLVLDTIDSMESLTPALKEQLAAQVMRHYYQQSAKDIEKYRIKRTGVTGPTVTFQGLSKYMNTMAFAQTQAAYHAEVQTMKERVMDVARRKGGNASLYANAVLEHISLAESPVVSTGLTRNFLNASYMWAMAFTPAVAFWQLASLATNTLPYLNSVITKGKGLLVGTAIDLADAMRDAITNRGWIAAGRAETPDLAVPPFTQREQELYDLRLRLMERGRMFEDAMRTTLDEMYSSRAMVKLRDWGNFFQHRSELLVTGTAAIAAYDAFKRANPNASTDEAFEFAMKTINLTQPSSSQFDRPILGKSTNFGKVAYLLKTYPIAVAGQMISDVRDILTLRGEDRRIALNRFVAQHSIMMMLGGVTVTPVGYALVAISSLAADDDEDPARGKLSIRDRFIAAIRESDGEEAASIARRGITPFIDTSGSLEISPLIMFRLPEDIASPKGVADILSQLLGPLFSTLNRASTGISVTEDWRQLMAWSPRAAQGALQVIGWASNEWKDLSRRGEFVTEVQPIEAFLRVLGFQPRAVQAAREDQRLLKSVATKMAEERRILLEAAYRASLNDVDISDQIETHNQLHTNYPKYQITPEQLAKYIEEREKKASEDRDPAERLKSKGITTAVIGREP